jgi:DNA polymerase III subunit delta
MLRIFYGPNAFAKKVELTKLKSEFISKNGQYSVRELFADELDAKSFAESLSNTGLFAAKELLILKRAEENPDLIRVALESPASELKEVILVVGSLDKRTSQFKEIQKHSGFMNFEVLSEAKLKAWVMSASKKLGVSLNSQVVQDLILRANSNQQEIWICLNQLSLLQKKEISSSDLETFLSPASSETAFALLEDALKKDVKSFQKTLKELELFREDPYQIIGLLCSQGYSLAAVTFGASSGRSPQAIAGEVGIHPFVASQQARLARSLSLTKSKVSEIAESLRWLDLSLKTVNKTEPWPMIDAALMRIAVL